MECVQGEFIWCKKHFRWRDLLPSTPYWTCALIYHWLYVTVNDCLVLFCKLCILGKASLPKVIAFILIKVIAFCLSEIPLCTTASALLYSLSYSIVLCCSILHTQPVRFWWWKCFICTQRAQYSFPLLQCKSLDSTLNHAVRKVTSTCCADTASTLSCGSIQEVYKQLALI